ncbi:MAG: response regulator, partial [Anaerolineaceae bacterium]|nr:response regulator [Anaerolineaceae bacterium]
ENSKFKVRTVQGGKNGLEEVKSSCPDAIILDLFMPDLDGFAVLEALRSEQLYQNIPVIILTGADLTPDQHQMLSDFGNQMLSKSMLKEKDLLASLEDALKKIQSQPRRPQMHTKPLG